MELIYLDDSGSTGTNMDDKAQPVFILGGVMLDDSKWHKVNESIENIKKDFGIDNCELHIMDIMGCKGIFEGWGYEKKKKLVKSCLEIIKKHKIKVVFFKVFKQNYKLYFESKTSSALQKMVKIPPYIIAYYYILLIFDEYLNKKDDYGIVIADEQDKTTQIAKDELKVLRVIDVPDIKIKNIVETSFFTSSKDSNLLQLADIVAYTIKRHLEIGYKDGIGEKSLAEREYYFDIIKDNVYEPDMDYTTHPILKYIEEKISDDDG